MPFIIYTEVHNPAAMHVGLFILRTLRFIIPFFFSFFFFWGGGGGAIRSYYKVEKLSILYSQVSKPKYNTTQMIKTQVANNHFKIPILQAIPSMTQHFQIDVFMSKTSLF